jgi:hypothetical protein
VTGDWAPFRWAAGRSCCTHLAYHEGRCPNKWQVSISHSVPPWRAFPARSAARGF